MKIVCSVALIVGFLVLSTDSSWAMGRRKKPVPVPSASPTSTPTTSPKPKPTAEPEEPGPAPDCAVCHSDIIEKKVKHEVAIIDCTMCHEVHGKTTQFPYRLKAKVNGLCMDCHDKNILRLDGGHVVQNHPVYLEYDPRYETGNPYIERRPFTCLSCHNPHSSDMPKLFRYDYKKPPYNGLDCAICHGDKVGIPPEEYMNPASHGAVIGTGNLFRR